MRFTLEDLNKSMEFNPNDTCHVFTWKKRDSHIKHDSFNSKYAGEPVGGNIKDQYFNTSFRGERLGYLHRIAYMFYHNITSLDKGPSIIDHKDRDLNNNSKSNLRDGTNLENSNQRNRKTIGKSKYKGVDLKKVNGKYRSRIVCNNKEVSLLVSSDEVACASMYKAACKYLGIDIDITHKDLVDVELPEKVKLRLNKAKSTPIASNKKSNYNCIFWNKKQQKWNAILTNPKGNKCIGSFLDEKEAAIMRDKYIIENNIKATLSIKQE